MQKIAYSYIRFSTKKQQYGVSYERQSEQAVAYCNAHNLKLDDKVYYDKGVSALKGKNKDIGMLSEFLHKVEDREIKTGSYLLIESLDRLSRDFLIHAQVLLNQIIIAGITVVTMIDKTVYNLDLVKDNQWLLVQAATVLIRANEESTTKRARA